MLLYFLQYLLLIYKISTKSPIDDKLIDCKNQIFSFFKLKIEFNNENDNYDL